LILELSYNWEFRFNKNDEQDTKKIFSDRDYVGNACKAMSSRIRGIIASKTFDDFHKNSHTLIKNAVLKYDSEGKIIPFKFSNNFYITDINSSGYTPVDKETEESL
jgi:major vault protein